MHLASAYDRYRDRARRVDHDGELLSMKMMQRRARENHEMGGYVIDPSRVVPFGDKHRARAVVVDVTKTEITDADELRPVARPRPPTWIDAHGSLP